MKSLRIYHLDVRRLECHWLGRVSVMTL